MNCAAAQSAQQGVGAFTSMPAFWPEPLCDHLTMRIEAPCVVSLTWKLTDAQNQPIDELTQPVEFYWSAATTCWPRSKKPCPATKPARQLHPGARTRLRRLQAELVCFEAARCFPRSWKPA
jgi:FKBP-type peptidyl-prolyl cis-trans isomerase SlyD